MANSGYVHYYIKFLKNISVKTFKCTKCRYYSKSISLIENHVKRHHPSLQPFDCEKINIEPYSCHQCDLNTSHFVGLKQHLQNTSVSVKEKNYTCKYCKFETISLMLSFLHKKNCLVKNSRSKWFQCDSCNHKTNQKEALQRDAIPDHALWTRCSDCGYRSQIKDDLERHIYIKHKNKNSNVVEYFHCNKCDYKSLSKNNLSKHIYRIHRGAVLHCELCDYKTKEKRYLKRHMLMKHTTTLDGQYFQCYQCDYRCVSKYAFKQHNFNKHSSVGDLHCVECNYKTKYNGEMKRHVLVKHTDPEDVQYFYCEKCNYKGKTKHNLKRHFLNMHGNSEYHCDKCDYKTKLKVNLEIHTALCNKFQLYAVFE